MEEKSPDNQDIITSILKITKIYFQLLQLEMKGNFLFLLLKILTFGALFICIIFCICLLFIIGLVLIFYKWIGLGLLSSLFSTFILLVLSLVFIFKKIKN